MENIKARANRGLHRGYSFLLSPVTMRTPVNVSTVESVRTIEAKPWSVVAIARGNDYANYWRRGVEDRARWWRRVIVRRCGSAVRLNHFSAGVRAQSRRKPECEHRQCYHNKFLPHERIFPPVVWPIEPRNHCEVAQRIGAMPVLARTSPFFGGRGVRLVANGLPKTARSAVATANDRFTAGSRRQRLQFGGFGRYFFSTSERYAS